MATVCNDLHSQNKFFSVDLDIQISPFSLYGDLANNHFQHRQGLANLHITSLNLFTMFVM